MNAKKFIFPVFFLFAILFSFSVSAYNSVSQASHVASYSCKNHHLGIFFPNNSSANNLVFEESENENDSEDFSCDSFFILPFDVIGPHISIIEKTPVADTSLSHAKPALIYLLVGVFRI